MTVYELAQKYYPKLWDQKRIQSLLEAGKLSEDEAKKLQKNGR